jgi:hypothetical protein
MLLGTFRTLSATTRGRPKPGRMLIISIGSPPPTIHRIDKLDWAARCADDTNLKVKS